MLGAAEQFPDGERVQVQSGGEFVIGEALSSEEKQLGLAYGHAGQDATNSLLFFFGQVNFFRSWYSPEDAAQQAIVSLAAGAPANFVDGQVGCRAIQPGCGIGMAVPRGPLEKDFDGEFLGPRAVMDDGSDEARDVAVVRAEEAFQIRLNLRFRCGCR